MTKLTPDQLTRLAFAKYLLNEAKTHLSLENPLSSFTVLILHDLTEIFLQVALEIMDPGKAKDHGDILANMTERLNAALRRETKPEMSIALLKRLNERRKSVKHNSIFIAHNDVTALHQDIVELIRVYFPLFFGIQIEEVTMVTLIQNDDVRKLMASAEHHIEKIEYSKSMSCIAEAVHLVRQHAQTGSIFGDSGRALSNVSLQKRVSRRNATAEEKKILQLIDPLVREIDDHLYKLTERVNVIDGAALFGVDLKDYRTFSGFIPRVIETTTRDGDKLVTGRHYVTGNERIAKFCFEFAVKICLKHQFSAEKVGIDLGTGQ